MVFSSDHGSPAIPTDEQAAAKQSSPRRQRRPDAVGEDRAALTLHLMGFNGGLRGGKHGMYEGGVRVPLVIRWPGNVPAGRVDQASVISGIDWLPTLCRIAGVEIDAADFEGEDVSACWLGQNYVRSKPLLWKTSAPGSPVGIRDGPWKLIHPTRPRGEIELYDLASDPGETRNAAAQHPDIVKRLSAKVQAWTAALPKEYIKTDDRED